MNYEIVETNTIDNLILHGMLSKQKSKYAIIFIHGTASNFYENYFIYTLTEAAKKISVSILSVNNRGSDVLHAYPPVGAATEFFEDCLKDIDAWIEFALSEGYTKIILMGHSLGSEKVTYYMNKGKYGSKVKGLVLLGFADSYGTQQNYTKGKNNLIEEANNMIKRGKGKHFISSDWFAHAGVLPKNAESYVNFFGHNSELSKALPLRNGKELAFYRKIDVPILAVIGDIKKGKEYTVIPIKQAMNLLLKENSHAQCHQIKNCNHDFEGKERELVKIISNWLVKTLL